MRTRRLGSQRRRRKARRGVLRTVPGVRHAVDDDQPLDPSRWNVACHLRQAKEVYDAIAAAIKLTISAMPIMAGASSF